MTATAIIDNSYCNTFGSDSKDSFCNEKAVYGDHNEIYHDITVLKALNKAKFPVYLVASQVNKQNYAMKVFPYKDRKPHQYFNNEIRFACLQHPNVIRNLYVENEKETISKGVVSKVSYTIMEYAQYGDFFDFVMDHGNKMDEMLMRTYFRQLIEGLEYLHKNGVSHLDLKLENLLLGKNYTLKIADFDLSYFAGDAKILSKGTNFYRAPELRQARCKNPNSADIYAAGVILFTLKTKGVLPHSEDNLISGYNFCELLHNNNPKFWTKHCQIQKKEQSFFDDDFKELFIAMTRPNCDERATLQAIKKSKWYNGPCYTTEEVKSKVSKFYGY